MPTAGWDFGERLVGGIPTN